MLWHVVMPSADPPGAMACTCVCACAGRAACRLSSGRGDRGDAAAESGLSSGRPK